MFNSLKIAILVGFFLFTMFFGAGNIVFPIKIGALSGDNFLSSILGFLLTGVGVPFLGVFTIILYKGQYKPFFNEIGKIPAFIVSFIIIAILGLFVPNPRCAILVFETNSFYLPKIEGMNIVFYVFYYGLISLICLNKSKVADVLGLVISPIKICALTIFMILAAVSIKGFLPATDTPLESFKISAVAGYNTTDLLCGFFFASLAYNYLHVLFKRYNIPEKAQWRTTIKAGVVGVILMSVIYIGFMISSAGHAELLHSVPEQFIIMELARNILGNYATMFIAFVVSCACFATSIALTTITVEFMKSTILKKLPYSVVLFMVVGISFMMSLLGFGEVMRFARPVLAIVYPALITLSLMALIYKLTGFRFIQVPFYVTLILAAYCVLV